MNKRFLAWWLGLLMAAAAAAGARPGTVDAGDGYLTARGRRSFLRRADAVAVRFDDAARRTALLADMISAKGALAGYAPEMDPGGGYVVLRAPEAERARLAREPGGLDSAIQKARGQAGVLSCNPVFVDAASGLWLIVTPEIILRPKPDADPRDLLAALKLPWRRLPFAPREVALTAPSPRAEDIFRATDRLATDDRIEWAEPDYLMERVRDFTPNDPKYTNQWCFDNVGQKGGVSDADLDAPAAWDITLGDSDIVIAVQDCGMQPDHPDLADNLFSNPGETVNGLDDDGNGLVDDLWGWNFAATNNDPSPVYENDNHGTAVAGMAAATTDNGIGLAGMAGSCRVMSVVDSQATNSVLATTLAEVLRYCAGFGTNGTVCWRGADIVNLSWHITPHPLLDSALDDIVTYGRGGKGCPVFAASANQGSGYFRYEPYILSPGTNGTPFYVEFQYVKDASIMSGEDRVWISYIEFPDISNTLERFDQPGLPPGWTAGGDAPFEVADDTAHAMGSGRYVARSGPIGDSEYSYLRSPVLTRGGGGDLTFYAWTSTEKRDLPKQGDQLRMLYHNLSLGTTQTNFIESGTPTGRTYFTTGLVEPEVAYPASYSNTIAVGASSVYDYRTDYSRWGTNLDFVAPGGDKIAKLQTTDRTSTNGYNQSEGEQGDYTYEMGTSLSAPLAAGIAALILSTDTNLTWREVRDRMRASCEKIGRVTYDANGWNEFYGYGRLNAYGALAGIPWDLVLTNPVVTDTRTYQAYNTITAFDMFRVQSPGDVTLEAGRRIDLGPGFQAGTGSVFRARVGELSP